MTDPVLLDERWRFRLRHPVGIVPDLVEQPADEPMVPLAQRLIRAYRAGPGIGAAGPVWDPLLAEHQGGLMGALAAGNAPALASELAGLGRSPAAQGFFGGAGQHRRCADDPDFGRRLALWTYDKLLSLAEALGVVPLELPENGSWGHNVQIAQADLFGRIQDALSVDLAPPPHVGGYLGIGTGAIVLQMRVVESIYAAWRLRELAREHGYSHVCEIGAGAGLTAYYARLLGVDRYTIIDLPTMNAVQGYMLGGSRVGEAVRLHGEDRDGGVAILPDSAFAGLEPGSIDILFNQDSLPEIEHGAALGYLRDAARLGIPLVLSINQEARLPTGTGHQVSVPSLMQETGGYRRLSRHRHWLREGYVEELYRLD